MSADRKRSEFNERVSDAHERKLWVEECRRIDRMANDNAVSIAQKRKRIEKKMEAGNGAE